MDKRIEISSSGHMLCDAYLDTSGNSGEKNTKNIFKCTSKISNEPASYSEETLIVIPIPLLLNVLKLLNEDENSSGIYRKNCHFNMLE